jgi:hypothetical protein
METPNAAISLLRMALRQELGLRATPGTPHPPIAAATASFHQLVPYPSLISIAVDIARLILSVHSKNRMASPQGPMEVVSTAETSGHVRSYQHSPPLPSSRPKRFGGVRIRGRYPPQPETVMQNNAQCEL